MILQIFGFLNLSFTDILDIILLGVIIFLGFKWIRGSSAMSIFIAIISLYIIRVIVSAMNMKLMSAIMGTLLDVGVIALIIIFQPEVRRFLTNLGNKYQTMNKGGKFLGKIISGDEDIVTDDAVNEISEACRRMSESKTGALIVLARKASLESTISTGDIIDAAIHRRLIMSLFFKNSPLHDGAIILRNNRIIAARCTLPITEKRNVSARYGMRHRAAMGITEETDAVAIVVSEETGHISLAKNGKVSRIKNINELKLLLRGQSND